MEDVLVFFLLVCGVGSNHIGAGRKSLLSDTVRTPSRG